MASIQLVDASVEIPIYNSRGRSLKTTLIRHVGGQVDTDGRDVVTVKALQHINLTLKPGDRLALVGHNGAGKSTLLRVFSGSYEPSSGIADVEGSVSSLIDIMMGMDPELTGADNIILRGVFVGMSLKESRDRIPEIAAFSELGPYLHLPMRTYSSGMRMRLAFAISTTRFPDILLFDEMISFGDAAFAEKARNRLQGMMDRASILALASHDPETLRRYCNRAIMLEEGSILAEGTVDEVLEFYAASLRRNSPETMPAAIAAEYVPSPAHVSRAAPGSEDLVDETAADGETLHAEAHSEATHAEADSEAMHVRVETEATHAE